MLNGHEGQQGASAVLVAAAMVLLLGMTAIAIDVGAGFNERRRDQTGADMAVLAGVLDYLDVGVCGGTGSEDGACNEVLDYVAKNLTTNIEAAYGDPAWIDAWRGCTDPDKPPGFGPLPSSPANGWTGFVGTRWDGVSFNDHIDCVSVSPSELRVKVPSQLTDTSFAGMLGVNDLRTSAAAQAGLFRSPGADPIIPYGVTSGTAGDSCVLQPPAGVAEDPCTGGSTGNFGAVLSQLWGSATSIQNCTSSSWPPGADTVRFHTANGLDHIITAVTDTGPLPPDPDAFDTAVGTSGGQTANPGVDRATMLDRCALSSGTAVPWDAGIGPAVDTGPINTLYVDTGASVSAEALEGFISGTPSDFSGEAVDVNAVMPRIKYGACGSPGPTGITTLCLNLGSEGMHLVDNMTLWDYLADPNLSSGAYIDPDDGTTCDTKDPAASPTPQVDSGPEMDCVLRSEPGEIFTDAIAESRRFVWVPEFWYDTWGTGIGWQPIKQFSVAFINSFWFNTTGSGTPLRWDPGTDPGPIILTNPNKLQAVSAFVIPGDALPFSVSNGCPICPGSPTDVELTR